MDNELSYIWLELHNVTELAVTSGVVAGITRRNSQDTEQDTTTLKEALVSVLATSATIETQHRKLVESFRQASMSTLIRMLDVLKWEDHDTLLKPPASSTVIHDAEERLGILLPDDYKEFLLVSNGIEFMPSINAPGFRPVEKLEWQDAEDLGLDDFRVELGCKTDPAEYDRLPKMSRLLVISDPDSEEMVWYVAPESVGEAIRVLKAEGRSDETVGQPGLR